MAFLPALPRQRLGQLDVLDGEDLRQGVAVEVDDGATGGPPAVPADSCGVGDVAEGSVAHVFVQSVLADVSHVDIGEAVAVEVAHGHALAVLAVAQPGLLGDIREAAVAEIAEEAVAAGIPLAALVPETALDEVQVGPAVGVIVDDSHAAAIGLDDVVRPAGRGRSVVVAKVEGCLGRCVEQAHVSVDGAAGRRLDASPDGLRTDGQGKGGEVEGQRGLR